VTVDNSIHGPPYNETCRNVIDRRRYRCN